MTEQMGLHYAAVKHKALYEKSEELLGENGVSKEFLDNVVKGLGNWVSAAEDHQIQWGWFEFTK